MKEKTKFRGFVLLTFVLLFIFFVVLPAVEVVLKAQQKHPPAIEIQQLKQQNIELGFLLKAEKADSERLILEKAVLQNIINQLNAKLIQTKQILQESIKNEKIDIKALNLLGFGLGDDTKLPSSLPDSTNSS